MAVEMKEGTVWEILVQSDIYLHQESCSTKGASVCAAAAGVIAADFSAAPTDSPLQTKVAQRLSAASQRFKKTQMDVTSATVQKYVFCNTSCHLPYTQYHFGDLSLG